GPPDRRRRSSRSEDAIDRDATPDRRSRIVRVLPRRFLQVARHGPGAKSDRAPTAEVHPSSEIASPILLALDGFEERLEISLAEAARAFSLDDLEEHSRSVGDALGEDLQQVALVA